MGGSTVVSQSETATRPSRLQGLQADWKCVRVGASAAAARGAAFLGRTREKERDSTSAEYVQLLPLSISIVRVACMLSDSVDDEMSHTSLCNLSVEPARKPAFVSFLCVTP